MEQMWVHVWGTVQGRMRDGLHLVNPDPEDPYNEVILHVSPETAVADGALGLPGGVESITDGDRLDAWIGPAVMMSLPPQAVAAAVVVNLPEGMAVGYHSVVTAELSEAGVAVTAADGAAFTVPPTADISPWRTRQIVRLEDIAPERQLLVWRDETGAVTRAVLFP